MSNNTVFPPNNGAVLTKYKIIKAVMSSAEEAELGALFINFKECIPARQSIEEMGHTQPPTQMHTENNTAHRVVTNNISSKRLKSMDMRLHWIRCRSTQGNFLHYWRLGATNLGDYVTNHHDEIHHCTVRPIYLTPKSQLEMLRNRVTPRRSLPEE